MTEISQEKKDELYELVFKQKKAKIKWVAMITQIAEEDIVQLAPDLGLIIDGEQILLHSETKEGKKSTLLEKSYNRIAEIALDERVQRSLYTAGGVQVKKPFWERGVLGMMGGQDSSDYKTLGGETRVFVYIYYLDGRIKAAETSLREYGKIRQKFYNEMQQVSGNKMHLFVPVSLYYKLFEIPRNAHRLDNNLKKQVMEACQNLDAHFDLINDKFVEKYITKTRKGVLGIGEQYRVDFISGYSITIGRDLLHLYKESIFMSNRFFLNSFYYHMVKTGKMQEAIDYVFEQNNIDTYYQRVNFLDHIFDSMSEAKK